MYFGDSKGLDDYFKEKINLPSKSHISIDHYMSISKNADDTIIQTIDEGYENEILPKLVRTISFSTTDLFRSDKKKATFFQQFLILTRRNFKLSMRSSLLFKNQIIETVTMVLLLYLLFGRIDKIDPSNPSSIKDRLSALFFIVYLQFYLPINSSVLVCELKSS